MRRLGAEEFLELAETIPIIDVRSPSEFLEGHIPGAVNIPLFDDEERAVVGTKYKKQGRQPAILEGLRLAGPSFHQKLSKAITTARENKVLVHCWRGGMRSESMAWLFSLGDVDSLVLDGGYKAYRNYILEQLSAKRKMIVLGGMTGSSKTHILKRIQEKGHQFIDLEGLANHKGSAFGSLGQPPQPTTEQFANDLFREWHKLDQERPLWLEDESRSIGTVFLPEMLYRNMQEVKTIVLEMDVSTRLPRLMKEYSEFSPEELKNSVTRISKRLGGDNTRDALDAIEAGDIAKAIEISLKYYDKAYQYLIHRKATGEIVIVKTGTDDIEENAIKVLRAAGY